MLALIWMKVKERKKYFYVCIKIRISFYLNNTHLCPDGGGKIIKYNILIKLHVSNFNFVLIMYNL